jgi:hypothetical protein
MSVFVDEADVVRSVGEILRLALRHPLAGPYLTAARTVLSLEIVDPDCLITVALQETPEICLGPTDLVPDVRMRMTGDDLDGFWRGQYDLVDGLASGEIAVWGRVSRILKILPHLQPLFPVYEALRPPA